MPQGYREFEFDLPQALLTHLINAFDSMEDALLSDIVREIPEAQGVYQLFHQGQLVYIGKTDAQAGLRQRLSRHGWTIQHRKNLDASKVTFKAIRVYVFTAVDLESQLIQHYKRVASVDWNFSGFGSNDPGRERDTTNVKPEGFDVQFPIDLDRQISIDLKFPGKAYDALTTLRKSLPYTLRFQTAARGSRKPHPDLEAADVQLLAEAYTARQLLAHIIKSLPSGWQGTLLPGRVILYKEERHYQFGELIAQS